MPGMITCPKCGAATEAGAAFCQNCGNSLAGGGVAVAGAQPMVMQPAVAQVHFAGFWIRFVAAFIDGLVIEAVVIPVSFVLGAMVGVAGQGAGANAVALQAVAAMLGALVGFGANLLYYTFLESSSKQATLGKMLLGLKVTDLTGQRISVGRALGRTLSKYISMLTLFIGFIMAGFTERKQALHDMIAGTYVIYGR